MSVKHKTGRTGRRSGKRTRPESDRVLLRLFIAGRSPRSVTALNNLKMICEGQLKGRYRIEVIDLLKTPRLARDYQILAIPTLVRKLPLPVRNIIGDLSDTESLLVGLDIVGAGKKGLPVIPDTR